VKKNHYFMMGDNEPIRVTAATGATPRSDVIGKAFVRIWPLIDLVSSNPPAGAL